MNTAHLAALESRASVILTAALRALNFNYASRLQLANTLVATAAAQGLTTDEQRWAAGYGLAKCGYGGGL